MTKRLYREMAAFTAARINCIKGSNSEWLRIHEQNIETLVGCLPHGSGLDGEWKYDFEKSTGERLILHMSYHAMDEMGGYDRWIDFTVTVTPSLQFGYSLDIRGNFGKYQDVKDYLYDILQDAFSQEVPA